MAKESSKAKVARHGIIYVAGQLAGSVAVFVTLIILARQLQPGPLGLYAIAIAFYTLLGIFSTFSLGTALRKKLAEDRSEADRAKLVSSAYSATLTLSLIIALIGILSSGFVATNIYHQPGIATALVFASILVILWALFNTTISVLVGIGRVKESAIVDVVYSVIQLIAAPGLVLLGYGITGAVAGLGIGLLCGVVAGVLYILKDMKLTRASVDPQAIKEIVGFSVPVFISSLALQGAYNLGILLLGTFASAAVVGNYYNAYKLGSLFLIIINAMTFVLLPAFSSESGRIKHVKKLGPLFNRALYFSVVILAPIVALTAALSKPIIFLFFSKVYSLAPPYLAIMSFGIVLGIVWNYANVLFLGIGDTRSVVKYQLIAAGIQVLLLAVLTPLFGILGMLAALFVISPIAINMLYSKVIAKKMSIRIQLSKCYKAALVSLALFIVVYCAASLMGFRDLSIIPGVLIGVLLYPPLLAMVGGIGKKDLKSMKEIFAGRRIGMPFAKLVDYAAIFAR